MKLETFTCVDASTGHITKKDNELLKRTDLPGISLYEYEYGYFVYLSEDETKESITSVGLSADFTFLYLKARETGAKFLTLDCDGTVYPDLPQHNW